MNQRLSEIKKERLPHNSEAQGLTATVASFRTWPSSRVPSNALQKSRQPHYKVLQLKLPAKVLNIHLSKLMRAQF